MGTDQLKRFPIEVVKEFPGIRFRTTGKIYEHSITDEQKEFHDCPATFRAVQAAIGSGKSAMGTIEALQHSWYYRQNFGFIIRKTMPQAEISAIPDLLDITPRWMIRSWSKQAKTLELLNQYGHDYMLKEGRYRKKSEQDYRLAEIGGISTIVFTSFEGTQEALNKWESSSIGWYMIDQAEWANEDIYIMLNERMRRQPAQNRAWFLANFRKDIPREMEWLWRIFSEESPDHRPDHWYSDRMTTESNKQNTPDNWHQILKDTLPPEEYARAVLGDKDKMQMTKQVFSEFSDDIHMVDHVDPPVHWTKGIGLDPGIGNPAAFVQVAFSPAGDVYVYDEFEKPNLIASEIAALLMTKRTLQHRFWFMDPTGGNRNQVTGTSVRDEFIAHGLPFVLAKPSNVGAGVMRIKEYMKLDPDHINPFTQVRGSPRLFISRQCTNLRAQLMLYRLDENKTHTALKNQTEKFRQWKDHEVDALRFIMIGATQPLGLIYKNKPGADKVSTLPGTKSAMKPSDILFQPAFDDSNVHAHVDVSRIIAQAMMPIKKPVSPRYAQHTPYTKARIA